MSAPAVISAAEALRKQRLERVAAQLRRYTAGVRPGRGEERCASGLAALDGALGGGLARGAIHELLAAGDGAALSVALLFAARAVARGGWVVFIETASDEATERRRDGGTEGRRDEGVKRRRDEGTEGRRDEGRVGELYPPGVAALGVPLERLVVVRAADPVDALWVCEQTLRCSAVAAVIAPLGRIEPYASRRLQLAAEAGGGVGLVVNGRGEGSGIGERGTERRERKTTGGTPVPQIGSLAPLFSVSGNPARMATGAAFAATRILFQPWPGGTESRRMLVSVLKVREGRPPEPFVLELPDTAGAAAAEESRFDAAGRSMAAALSGVAVGRCAGAGGSSAPSKRESPHAAGDVSAHAVPADRPGAAGRAAAG